MHFFCRYTSVYLLFLYLNTHIIDRFFQHMDLAFRKNFIFRRNTTLC